MSAVLLAACSPVQQLQNVASAGGTLANSMTGMGEQVPLSALELRQLQSREFAGTKAAAFASVMTVLLDSGYRIASADLGSGLVTATAASTDRVRLDIGGVAKATQTPMASAYVEERGPGSVRVRVNFSVARSATGLLGSSGERPVLDAAVYEAFFARLQEEMLLRPNPAEPYVPAPPVPTSIAPQSPTLPAADADQTIDLPDQHDPPGSDPDETDAALADPTLDDETADGPLSPEE